MDVQNVQPHLTLIITSYERFVVNFVHIIVGRDASLLELYILLLQAIGRGLIIVADEL